MKTPRFRHVRILLMLICLVLVLQVIMLSGCQRQNMLLQKVPLNAAPSAVKAFISRMEQTNGFYLFNSDSSDPYLFLNSNWVVQGNPAVYFTDVAAEIQGNELLIRVSDQQTRDYASVSNNRILYRITANQAYDMIRLFRNDEHTPFTTIGN